MRSDLLSNGSTELVAEYLICCPVGRLVLLRVLTRALFLVQLPVFVVALVRAPARAERLTTSAVAAVTTQNINAVYLDCESESYHDVQCNA